MPAGVLSNWFQNDSDTDLTSHNYALNAPPCAHPLQVKGVHLRHATAFQDVQCPEGYQCVSRVKLFGVNHDGGYHGLPVGVKLPSEYKNAYEVNCPARGAINAAGECKDKRLSSEDNVTYCWSAKRFEGGGNAPCKEADDCKCIKATDAGMETLGNQYSRKTEGKEMITQKFLVAPKAQCDHCADHDCNPSMCNKCEDCEYTTKTMGGRKSEGCYDRPKKKKQGDIGAAEDRRIYLDGDEPTETDLQVIPHLKLWDPGGSRDPDDPKVNTENNGAFAYLFPYQNHSEPLSKKAWLEKWPKAGARIQRLIDVEVSKVMEAANNKLGMRCSEDIIGRHQKLRFLRRGCKEMDAIQNQLDPKSTFNAETVDTSGVSHEVGCMMSRKKHVCERLNCHFQDPALNQADKVIVQRDRDCNPERAALARMRKLNPPPEKKKAGLAHGVKPTEIKPAVPKAMGAVRKPPEGKYPPGTKPPEGKDAEGNPIEGKPEEGKPEEGKPEEGKPEEGKEEEGKPEEAAVHPEGIPWLASLVIPPRLRRPEILGEARDGRPRARCRRTADDMREFLSVH